MRALFLSSCTVVVWVASCGGPNANDSPSKTSPVVTASVGSVAAPPISSSPSPLSPSPSSSSSSPPPASSATTGLCTGKCAGRVGYELVDAISKRAKQAHRCYDNALATDKTIRGKVIVKMTIADDGRMCEVRADTETKALQPVANCVAGYFRTGEQFPAPDGGCAEINAPINFVPRTDDGGAP